MPEESTAPSSTEGGGEGGQGSGGSSGGSSSSSSGGSGSGGGGSSKSISVPRGGSRVIFGLMGFAVLFSLIGNEIKVAQSNPKGTQESTATGQQVGAGVTVAGKIIIGGFFATTLLILLSHAGEEGQQVATGLATVTVLSAALIYGGPVWDAANGLFGSQPTTPLGGSSAATEAVKASSPTASNPYLFPTTSPTGATQ